MKILKALAIFLLLAAVIVVSISAFGAPKNRPRNQSKDQPKNAAKVLDGDTVWKQQCSRCHLAPGDIPKKKMVTIIRHMRTVTPLTEAEYKAVLEFITK